MNNTPFKSLDFLPKERIPELNLLPKFSDPNKFTQSFLSIDSNKEESLPSVKDFLSDLLRLLQTQAGLLSF